MSEPAVSVVIATRNRGDELLRALKSCYEQQGVDLEVLVFDDASEPPLAPWIEKEFPAAKVIRSEVQVGYIVLRNRGFRLAKHDLIASLDDDAEFSNAGTLKEAISAFDEYPKAAAFALKYVEPEGECHHRQLEHGSQVRSYVGCAHIIHRATAVSLGGYRESLVHQGEERDLCLRIWASGREVRYLSTPSIVHRPSPKRDNDRWDFYGMRNTFLFSSLNLPISKLAYRLCADTFLLVRHFVPRRGWATTFKWLGLSYFACFQYWRERRPVSAHMVSSFWRMPPAGPSPNSNSLR
jgi:GT2 family glycosyltransferase